MRKKAKGRISTAVVLSNYHQQMSSQAQTYLARITPRPVGYPGEMALAPPHNNPSSIPALGSDYSDDEEMQELQNEKNGLNPNWIPGVPFRLMDLPAELRVNIYQFLLPHNMNINFRRTNGWNPRTNSNAWSVHGTNKVEHTSPAHHIGIPYIQIVIPPLQYSTVARCSTAHRLMMITKPGYSLVETQLFLVNKEVSNEARAVLYGSNTWRFIIDSDSHAGSSLRSPLIFGPLGTPNALPSLRNLRNIHLQIIIDKDTHWAVTRQRSRLEYFVEVLKEHADNENRKSLLEELTIHLAESKDRHVVVPRIPRPALPGVEKYMFGLESLASLRGIKKVNIEGVPEWYAKCLQVCIQGKGGDIEEVDWPLITVKRRKRAFRSTFKKGLVSTRKWYQPMLNWKEFGECNGIELPEDIDKYWIENYGQ